MDLENPTTTSLNISMCDQYFNIEGNGYMAKNKMDHISELSDEDKDDAMCAPMCFVLFIVFILMIYFFKEEMLEIISPKNQINI